MNEFGQARRMVERQRDPLRLRLQIEHGDQLGEELGEADRLPAQRQCAAFDLRDVEQAFNQMRQMFGAAADHARGIERVLAVIALQQLSIAIDRIERRADLVADAGEEAGLGFIGGFGGLLGGAQLRERVVSRP